MAAASLVGPSRPGVRNLRADPDTMDRNERTECHGRWLLFLVSVATTPACLADANAECPTG